MERRVVPMIHVPDVRAAVAWYEAIGFTLVRANEDNGEMDWALVRFGDSGVMFSEGGHISNADRREIDLYLHAEDVDAAYAHLSAEIDVVEAPHNTFYGMREFIVRDLNRFWVTFGEPVSSA
ncbi:MAG: hypothetical protein U0795_11890 [Pirellulales bacterium]